MPLLMFIAISLLMVVAGLGCYRLYLQHSQGHHAVEKTIEVTVLDKQMLENHQHDSFISNANSYWIWVQKGRFGPKREFEVTFDYFQVLNPGDKGQLTYHGDQFIHFALQR